jgi:hypothetical protein
VYFVIKNFQYQETLQRLIQDLPIIAASALTNFVANGVVNFFTAKGRQGRKVPPEGRGAERFAFD